VKLSLVGVSHRQAPVELRERVALDLERSRELARRLAADGEAVVLSTCNRTELYVVREDEQGEREALDVLVEQAPELGQVAYRLHDDAAALHLFRVAAGLDSLVPGEGEILGQVRDAAEAGAAGPFLERLFRHAVSAGRKVRVETAIGEAPSSVPAAAAALAQQVFGELQGRRVLLLGAGRMSELTARNLLSRGAELVTVAHLSREHRDELAPRNSAR
jgi:glutamyl-tRNA reductase